MTKAARATRSATTTSRPGALLTSIAIAFLLLWMSFTASLKAHELLLGACVTLLSLALLFKLLRMELLHVQLRLRDLWLIWQLPSSILKDCWILTAVLFADLTGKQRAGSFYRACGFHISMHDPVLIGRGALAIAYTTASPNMMVLGIDPAQSLMLFHQLRRDPVPAFAQALGAAGQHDIPAHTAREVGP